MDSVTSQLVSNSNKVNDNLYVLGNNLSFVLSNDDG